jgi:hypothetical protein
MRGALRVLLLAVSPILCFSEDALDLVEIYRIELESMESYGDDKIFTFPAEYSKLPPAEQFVIKLLSSLTQLSIVSDHCSQSVESLQELQQQVSALNLNQKVRITRIMSDPKFVNFYHATRLPDTYYEYVNDFDGQGQIKDMAAQIAGLDQWYFSLISILYELSAPIDSEHCGENPSGKVCLIRQFLYVYDNYGIFAQEDLFRQYYSNLNNRYNETEKMRDRIYDLPSIKNISE